MTVYGKYGKTIKLFSHPSHRPWKSQKQRFPHSHRHDYHGRNISQTFNVPGVGQNKMPKWAKPACQTHKIQFLLGHVSVQTTERYIGCRQRFRAAVNDKLGIEAD